MQKLFMVMFLMVTMQTAYNQPLPTLPSKKSDNKPVPKPKTKSSENATDYNTQAIKFISDIECNLFIDGEQKGHLQAGTVLKLNLAKGQYVLQAKAVNGQNELQETLAVDEIGADRVYNIKLIGASQTKNGSDLNTRSNSDLLKAGFILVQGGTFNMGSNASESSYDEKPVHQVTVSSFYISKYLVTQAQWQAVMGNNPSGNKCDNCPVENITWDDAQAYCQKQSSLTGKTYRLPTEAEWEYAARGGNKSNGYTYSGSNNIDEVAWYTNNSGGTTHPVGQKQPNELGLYDMTGNVWEWCSDWYDDNYYGSSPAQNPQGPSTGSYRVIRGGSWSRTPLDCRAAGRNYDDPGDRNGSVGFRPVVSF